MKVERRRGMVTIAREAKAIYNRIRKQNKKTKLTLIDIINLKKKFRDIDIESYVDSSVGYYENLEILKEVQNGKRI